MAGRHGLVGRPVLRALRDEMDIGGSTVRLQFLRRSERNLYPASAPLECLTGLPCTVLLGNQGFALVFRGFSERVCILPLSVGSQSGSGKLRGKAAPVCPLPGPAVMRSSDRDRLSWMITPILRIGHPFAGVGLPTGRDGRDGFTAAVGGRRQGSWESPAEPSIRARLRLPRLYQDEEPRFAAGKSGKDGYSGCLRRFGTKSQQRREFR